MVKKESIDKVLQKLDKTSRLSNKIDKDLEETQKAIEGAPTGIIDTFRRYTDPQQNLEALLIFYKVFIATGEYITKMFNELEKYNTNENNNTDHSDLKNSQKEGNNTSVTKNSINNESKGVIKSTKSIYDGESRENIDKTEFLNEESIGLIEKQFSDKKKFIEIYKNVNNELLKIENYKDFNVVKKFIKDSKNKINEIQEPIHTCFFKHLPKMITLIEDDSVNDIDSIQKISNFLLEVEEKIFVEEYCKIMINFYSHKSLKTEEFVNRLKLIGDCFSRIEKVNDILLNESKKEIIDAQLKQLLLIEIREIVVKTLLSFDNKFKQENIIYTCEIYLVTSRKEIEKHFKEYREEILGTLNNLLLIFIDNIDIEKKPNKSFRNEEWILVVYKLLKIFKNNKDLENDFFHLYSDNFDFGSYKQMNSFFGKITYEKIFMLSDELKGIQKNVYLLNNLHMVDLFFKEYRGEKVANFFSKLMSEIVEMWRSECDKRKKDKEKGQKFLDINLDIQKQYFLPDEMREYLIKEISEIVERFVMVNGYKNGRAVLDVKLNNLFSGK